MRACFGFLFFFRFVGLLRVYFCFVLFVLRSVYEFYTQNIVVHTACEHTTTDATVSPNGSIHIVESTSSYPLVY